VPTTWPIDVGSRTVRFHPTAVFQSWTTAALEDTDNDMHAAARAITSRAGPMVSRESEEGNVGVKTRAVSSRGRAPPYMYRRHGSDGHAIG
jgi:hypothetical protein